MAIDPDVQVKLDEIQATLDALNTGDSGLSTSQASYSAMLFTKLAERDVENQKQMLDSLTDYINTNY
jgi:uncharacterized protein YoxC